ncbi:MAG: repeat protein [Myxococcaceae bacterium]|nr:repeat protein [Myxococcaceae bacterium]
MRTNLTRSSFFLSSRIALGLLGVTSLSSAACGKKEADSTTTPAAAGTTGGEQAGTSKAPAAAAAGTPAAAATSPWGSPEADKGQPLPPRKPMNSSAQSDYEDGLKAAAAGNLDKATSEFNAAVSADPNAYLALHALGVVSDRAGKEAQAIDYYRKAMRIQPDYEESAQGIVAIYIRQGQAARAQQFMQPLAQQWERNLLLQAYYANLLTQMGRPAEAITTARAALKRDERFVPAMMSLVQANLSTGKVELADSILDQALSIDGKNAQLHYFKGKRYAADSRLSDAITEFRKAVELDPDFAEARMELGLRLLAGANYDEALQQLQAVDKLSPRLVEVQLALGDAYRSKGQWTDAKASFDKALRMRSDLPQAHFDLALLYMSAGTAFPGPDLLTSLGKAKDEFATYRTQMGSKLPRDDPSTAYLDDIDKSVAREQKRIDREAKAAQRGARTDAPAAPAGATK